jgi:hypothetical protein
MPSRLTTTEFIDRAKLIHGDKYDYSEVEYTGAYKPVTIICKIHGSFTQIPHYHLDKSGCTVCGKEIRASKKRKSVDYFIEKFKNKHGSRYDYSLITNIESCRKVRILCKEHGVFKQSPSNHIKGAGCPLCYRDLHTRDGFLKRAIQIHGDKYDYSLVPNTYLSNSEKLNIICKKHGVFKQQKRTHIIGQGCPSCKSFSSKAEKQWLSSLDIPDMKRQYKLKDIKINVDGYSPSRNTVYEFYGDFWHANPSVFNKSTKHPMLKGTFGEVYKRTLLRELKIRLAGYNLKTIWEADWKELYPF